MLNLSYEWQFFSKDLRFKCRSHIFESDILEDMSSEFSIDEFLKKNFVKLQLQVLRWSKDL